MKPETDLQKAEREFNDAQRKKYDLERAARKQRVLDSLHMFPSGWEEKVAAAAVQAVRNGDENCVIELAEMSCHPRQPYSVTVSLSMHVFAFDYSKSIDETLAATTPAD